MIFIIKNIEVKQNLIREVMEIYPNGLTEAVIREHKSKRSLQQNALYWKWLSIIGNHIGSDKDEMHRTFAIRFLGPELFVVDGKQYVGAKSTTKLSTKEFSEYMDMIHATAMELGLTLPQPNYFGLEVA